MSTRSIFTSVVLAIVLLGTLPTAAQDESVGKQVPAITHNTWKSGAAMPTPVYYPAAGVLENEIYIVGGGVTYTEPTADVQVYNPATNTWSTGVPLPNPIGAEAAAVVKNVLYIIGGSTDGGATATNAVWAYSPKTKTWSAKAAMPTARFGVVAVVDRNIVYVIDGYNGTFLTTVESYNTTTDTWTEEAPELVAKEQFTAGLIGNTLVGFTIVATDGISANNVAMADNEGYNTGTNAWTSLTADPTARTGACGGAIGPSLYVAGGYSTGTITLTESFKLSKNTWKTLADMPQATLLPGSAVYKGQLYCIGGITTFEGTLLGNVQIYQP
ncbi:MAG: Kelch repeat-containing protein [Terriglobales bacterium]|jgi:N-acetylneuraminic acid mutarotase